MALSYPFLSKALRVEDGGCFDPTDPSVQKSMRSLLRELNALLSTTYELNTTDMSNNKICYVRVPRTSSDSSFRNSKEWLDAAIQISGLKQNDTFNAAYRIANHLLRFYKDSVLAACETQKSTCVQSNDRNTIPSDECAREGSFPQNPSQGACSDGGYERREYAENVRNQG
jgi:hypothetical protein